MPSPAKRMTLEQKIRLIRQAEQNPSWTRDELRLWAMPKFKLAELPAPKTISRVLQTKDELLLEFKRKQSLGLVPSARMSYEQKLELVQKKEKKPDWKATELAKWAKTRFKLAQEPGEKAIARILDQKEQLLERQETGQNMAVKSSRSAHFPLLEEQLIHWVHEQETVTGKRVQGNAIREKAHALWTMLAASNEEEAFEVATFSNGWLDGFKRRHGLVNERKMTKKKQEALQALRNTKTPGRTPVIPEIEAQLYEWIREQQAVSDKRIIGNDIKDKARELVAASGQSMDKKQVCFSNGWLDGFRKRYGLVHDRKSTTAGSISSSSYNHHHNNETRPRQESHNAKNKRPRAGYLSIAEIEVAIFNWINHLETHDGKAVGDREIKQKARELLAATGQEVETDVTFANAWLDDFKRRFYGVQRVYGSGIATNIMEVDTALSVLTAGVAHRRPERRHMTHIRGGPMTPSLAPMEPVIALAELGVPSPVTNTSYAPHPHPNWRHYDTHDPFSRDTMVFTHGGSDLFRR